MHAIRETGHNPQRRPWYAPPECSRIRCGTPQILAGLSGGDERLTNGSSGPAAHAAGPSVRPHGSAMSTAIILPVIALVLLTAIVWVRLYVERIRELRHRRIDPQAVATSASAAQTLQSVQASDNFKNLFEVPILFYALCAVLTLAQHVSPFFVMGAWLYVALRYIHSLIHLTYNRVTHRFAVYALSTVILFMLWGVLGVQVLLRGAA